MGQPARVVVEVMLKPEILDPQGEAVIAALPRLGVEGVRSVRIGKRIELEFDGTADLEQVKELADKLLANPVIEDFTVRLDEPAAAPAPAATDGRKPKRRKKAAEPAAEKPS